MKKIIHIFTFMLMLQIMPASSQEPVANPGIHFFEGTWQEAVQKSVKENKLIFLDLSTSWCGWCKKMKQNTYSQKMTGDFFNAHFINIELDGEHGEGQRLAHKFGVSAYPSVFIVDKDENAVLSSEGYHEADDLLKLVKGVLKEK
jgi:thioredoxin 1